MSLQVAHLHGLACSSPWSLILPFLSWWHGFPSDPIHAGQDYHRQMTLYWTRSVILALLCRRRSPSQPRCAQAGHRCPSPGAAGGLLLQLGLHQLPGCCPGPRGQEPRQGTSSSISLGSAAPFQEELNNKWLRENLNYVEALLEKQDEALH